MDSQLAQPQNLRQRLLLALLAIAIGIVVITIGLYLKRMSDPYVQTVLSLQGDLNRGAEIFQINCAGCHGKDAHGSIGPSLHDVPKRKSRISLIEQVTSGKTPPMPKFQPSTQEMADLLSYLENL